eukprot:3207310-Rhodomonas_salina.1
MDGRRNLTSLVLQQATFPSTLELDPEGCHAKSFAHLQTAGCLGISSSREPTAERTMSLPGLRHMGGDTLE